MRVHQRWVQLAAAKALCQLSNIPAVHHQVKDAGKDIEDTANKLLSAYNIPAQAKVDLQESLKLLM